MPFQQRIERMLNSGLANICQLLQDALWRRSCALDAGWVHQHTGLQLLVGQSLNEIGCTAVSCHESDHLIIRGMANTFLAAKEVNVGASTCEPILYPPPA